jgi:TetR/AcrR family transcriptional regulator, cholesterol catabolism regulator
MSTTATEVDDDSALPPAQEARRLRILEAARNLAIEGGYDGVQMRDVADRAEVALGTLYRYFRSKVELLIAVMHHETTRLAGRITSRPPTGETAAERVDAVLQRGVRALRREPRLAEAMVRALTVADPSTADDVDRVTQLMTDAVTRAMQGPDRRASPDDPAIARVLEQVWLSAMVAWTSGRATEEQLVEDIATATRLLVR